MSDNEEPAWNAAIGYAVDELVQMADDWEVGR